MTASPKWPKQRPELSTRQISVMEDWYATFLNDVLPGKFGWIDRIGHQYAMRSLLPGGRTLEIGPGNGSHITMEPLVDQNEYVALELRESLSRQIIEQYPNLRVVVGDCQERLDFPDDYFDRVLAIHVLEHLDNLPAALAEVSRVLTPTGRFSVVIPCEGGSLYSLGRRFTTQRVFERRYKMPYEWMIRYDHINVAREVVNELRKVFSLEHQGFYPFRVPSIDMNIVLGLTLSLPARPGPG